MKLLLQQTEEPQAYFNNDERLNMQTSMTRQCNKGYDILNRLSQQSLQLEAVKTSIQPQTAQQQRLLARGTTEKYVRNFESQIFDLDEELQDLDRFLEDLNI